MEDLLPWVASHKRTPATITLAHKTTAEVRLTTDTTQQVIVDSASIASGHLMLAFLDPANANSPAKITIKVPLSAQYTLINNVVTFEYLAQATTIRLKLEIHAVDHDQKDDTEGTFVREIKNQEGEIEKILIHIPENSLDVPLISTAAQVLHALFSEWETLSLAKRLGGQQLLVYKRINFRQLSPITLPGESFFQLTGQAGKEEVMIEIPLEVFIHLTKKVVSFTLDGISYDIVKAQ